MDTRTLDIGELHGKTGNMHWRDIWYSGDIGHLVGIAS